MYDDVNPATEEVIGAAADGEPRGHGRRDLGSPPRVRRNRVGDRPCHPNPVHSPTPRGTGEACRRTAHTTTVAEAGPQRRPPRDGRRGLRGVPRDQGHRRAGVVTVQRVSSGGTSRDWTVAGDPARGGRRCVGRHRTSACGQSGRGGRETRRRGPPRRQAVRGHRLYGQPGANVGNAVNTSWREEIRDQLKADEPASDKLIVQQLPTREAHDRPVSPIIRFFNDIPQRANTPRTTPLDFPFRSSMAFPRRIGRPAGVQAIYASAASSISLVLVYGHDGDKHGGQEPAQCPLG